MSRPTNPQAKRHDPAYQAARNHQDRHRPQAQIGLRVPEAVRDRWHAAAAAQGLTLKAWIIHHLNRAARDPENPERGGGA